MNTFTSKKQVINFLNEKLEQYQYDDGKTVWCDKSYTLKKGENERPYYTPRRYKNGWGVHVEYFYNAGSRHALESGRTEESHHLYQF